MNRLSCIPLVIFGAVASASAETIFDQYGVDGSLFSNEDFTSQDEGPPNEAFNGMVIDDFTTASPYRLSTFMFAQDVSQFAGRTSFPAEGITKYTVSIYSAPAAATAISLSGDVATITVLPASATLTPFTFTGVAATVPAARITLDLTAANFVLAPGSYYIGVNTSLDYVQYDQVFNIKSTVVGGPNPRFINPGNGFGLGQNSGTAITGNMAYRLEGQPVPEPASCAAVVVGFLAFLRRRKTVDFKALHSLGMSQPRSAAQ